jgi:type I restriction enzyme S subunit
MSSEQSLFRSLLQETKDGEWGKDAAFEESVEMHVIRGTDFENAWQCSFEGVPVRYIAGKAAARKILQPNDILIETAGGSKGKPTGKTVFLRPELFERSKLPITCASFARFLRIDSAKAEPEYIYWVLQSIYKSGLIENYQVQHTGIARFQFTKFADFFEIQLPRREYQIQVCKILGNFDKRITLLRETNTTLEAIAQALFKSWFVDFDPVHAKQQGRAPEGMDAQTAALFPDSFEESELGMVPKGWKVGILQDLLVLQRGFDLPASQREEGEYPIIAASGNSGSHRIAQVKGPGVITGRSGVLGKVFLELKDFWPLNTALWVKEFKAATPCYAYELLSLLDFSSFNAGSAVPTLNRNHVHGLPYLIPDSNVVEAYEKIALSLHQRSECNREHAMRLEKLRDILLPRLISGQLRLPDAQALVEEAEV